MSKSHTKRTGNGHDREPIGIVVLDRHPVPSDPRLRAFVWCPRRRSKLPAKGAAPAPLRLMVGQATLTALDEN